QAANTARANEQHEALWQARTTAGQIYLALNQPDKARQAFAEAIRTIDGLRNEVPGGESELEAYFENKVGPYTAMTGLSVAENNAPEALAYAERAKGRVILEALRNGRIKPDKAMTAQARELLRDEQSALLEYAVVDEQVYLFVLTKGAASAPVALRALTLPTKRSELAARVEKFRQRLANRDLDYAAMAAELYNLLLKP